LGVIGRRCGEMISKDGLRRHKNAGQGNYGKDRAEHL
jgi:hypothetical protein